MYYVIPNSKILFLSPHVVIGHRVRHRKPYLALDQNFDSQMHWKQCFMKQKRFMCHYVNPPPHIFMYYLRGLKYWISWKALPQILLLPCSIAKRSFLGLFRWRCYLWWLDLEGRECLRRWQGSTWWKSGCTPIILFVLKCLITLITPIWLALTLDWDN